MRLAHLKTHQGFERMRLRGLSGARRVPSRRRRPEPQDARAPKSRAATGAHASVPCVGVRSGRHLDTPPHVAWWLPSKPRRATKTIEPKPFSTASVMCGRRHGSRDFWLFGRRASGSFATSLPARSCSRRPQCRHLSKRPIQGPSRTSMNCSSS
jgi:hypothetical protein